MNDNSKKLDELLKLLSALREGILTESECARLEELLCQNTELQDCYLTYIRICAEMRSRRKAGIESETGSSITSSIDSDGNLNESYKEAWMALAENERTAEGIRIEKPKKVQVISPVSFNTEKQPHRVSRVSLYTAVISTAALLFIMVYVRLYPRLPLPDPVAVLTDSMGAEWAESAGRIVTGDVLLPGPLRLDRGLASITFNEGARIIVQAPAEILLETENSVFVKRGKVSAHVPERAMGFVIHTPSSSIIDLGTEFGVSVYLDGTSDIHMFNGSASLVAGKSGTNKNSRIIEEGYAASVDGITNAVREIQTDREVFVRQFSSGNGFVWYGQKVNLADIVGGGNGFGTGKLGQGLRPKEKGQLEVGSIGTGLYEPVLTNMFINGVFVPDGGIEGRMQVSTAGHIFDECPDTSGYFNRFVSYGIGQAEKERIMQLNGRDYITEGHPGISMHSNMGITFDLKAICSVVPGLKPARFTAFCGVSEGLKHRAVQSEVVFYVLVDGKRRFQVDLRPQSGPAAVVVELRENDRFLTLMTTEGGDTIASDWGLFAEPVLELEVR